MTATSTATEEPRAKNMSWRYAAEVPGGRLLHCTVTVAWAGGTGGRAAPGGAALLLAPHAQLGAGVVAGQSAA